MQLAIVVVLAFGLLVALLIPSNRRIAASVLGGLAILILVPAGSLGWGPLGGADTIFAATVWVILISVTTLRKLQVSRLFALLIVVIIIGALSSLLITGNAGFSVTVALSGIVFIGAAGLLNQSEWVAVRGGVIALALVIAAICLLEAFVLNAPIFTAKAYGLSPLFPDAIRAQATLGHPLVAAMVMLVGIGFTLTVRLSTAAKLLIIGALTVGVLSTGSTSAIIASVFCAVAGFIASGRSNSRVARVALAAVVAFFVAALSLVPSGLLEDVSSKNSVHRLNSFLAIPRLFTSRSLPEALFGSGWGSEQLMYQRNILIDDNFFAIDNQFTTVIVVSGGVGILLFLVFVVGLLVKSRGTARVTLLALVLMFLSFDVLNWAVTGALFITFATFAVFKPQKPESPNTDPREMNAGDDRPRSLPKAARPRV